MVKYCGNMMHISDVANGILMQRASGKVMRRQYWMMALICIVQRHSCDDTTSKHNQSADHPAKTHDVLLCHWMNLVVRALAQQPMKE